MRGVLLVLGALLALPSAGLAFCGFFVSGADAELYNDASQVVLMRKGNRTVMSMSNNYKGPTEAFAMVVPVPVVLQEEQVKTLPTNVFTKVDQLSAPRLVEYWEQDPCYRPPPKRRYKRTKSKMVPRPSAPPPQSSPDLGVTVEAEFVVGEYQIGIFASHLLIS